MDAVHLPIHVHVSFRDPMSQEHYFRVSKLALLLLYIELVLSQPKNTNLVHQVHLTKEFKPLIKLTTLSSYNMFPMSIMIDENWLTYSLNCRYPVSTALGIPEISMHYYIIELVSLSFVDPKIES